ncbi:MAG: hypothetical protein VX228_10485, partial [Pseudomonadota bacterium]|nr:hypothetical protein [Pseudomonadota bacterium]
LIFRISKLHILDIFLIIEFLNSLIFGFSQIKVKSIFDIKKLFFEFCAEGLVSRNRLRAVPLRLSQHDTLVRVCRTLFVHRRHQNLSRQNFEQAPKTIAVQVSTD